MAHVLTGDWRSFVIKTGGPSAKEDLKLVVNEGSGVIEPGSKHAGADITGKASPGNSPFHHIQIDKAAPKQKFKAFLLVNGPQLIMVGLANLDAETFLKRVRDLKDDEILSFFDQQQEVWIATKP